MNHRAAGKHHGVLGLIQHRVVASGPSRILADPHVAVGDHLFHVLETLSVIHAQPIAGEMAGSLDGIYVTGKQNRVALVIKRHRV